MCVRDPAYTSRLFSPLGGIQSYAVRHSQGPQFFALCWQDATLRQRKGLSYGKLRLTASARHGAGDPPQCKDMPRHVLPHVGKL
jgi:hypothetical protein